MKIIFFGSSEFSIPALQACLQRTVAAVVTIPDQKQGRGLQSLPTPVRTFAEKNRLKVFAPERLKNELLLKEIADLKPDVFVASSYGKLIPSDWLKIPKMAFNVHPSLLPKYRGAAPLHWPLIRGEQETGLSIAEITGRLDAGDLFLQISFPLDESIDSVQLSGALSKKSFELLTVALNQFEAGSLKRIPQDDAKASLAPKLKKSDGLMSWQWPAREMANRVRGLLPWPTAHVLFSGQPLQILKAQAKTGTGSALRPGEIAEIGTDGSVHVQTGQGILCLSEVRLAGKRAMSAADFAHGRRLAKGSSL